MALDLSRLTGGVGFRIHGTPYDRTGASVGAVDLNGDGISDLVIGAPYASPDGLGQAGETFVVYGAADGWPDELDLGTLDGGNGLHADGVSWGDRSGTWVADAGDLNGDGVGDLAIGGPASGKHGAWVHVLFGATGGFGDAFDLAALDGDNGFRIHGIGRVYPGPMLVSGGGDINGDGFDDLVIGAPNGGAEYRGRTYVVFGAPDGIPPDIDLAELDDGGFWLEGVAKRDYSGHAAAIAGDLNGDGLDDLVIGAPGGANSGRAYVVYGSKRGFSGIDLAKLDGGAGFRIDGAYHHQAIGAMLGSAGDVNGDGIDDLLVTGEADAAYVVFGSTDRFDPILELADLDGTNGFRLRGGADGHYDNYYTVWSGASGDVNGDGMSDLILRVSDPWYDPGMTYLVYGRAGAFAPTIDLPALEGAEGLRIEGAAADSVTVGDLNADGLDDMLIGGGRTHVIFGTPQLGGANDAPSAADDAIVVGTRSIIDLTADHGAGFDTDSDFSDLTITAIDGRPIGLGDGFILASGLRARMTGATEVQFDRSGLPFGAMLSDSFSYRIADGHGGYDIAFVSVQHLENDVRAVDGDGGFRIDWSHGGDRSGYSIASADDVNGDGVDDLLIGAPYGGAHDAGRAWVVFGSPEGFDPRLNLADLCGENGFAIRGATRGDHLGWSVAGAGDMNGDGLDDIILGAPDGGRTQAGRSYVIFGSAEGFNARFHLRDLNGENGFSIRGIVPGARSGTAVAAAGDMDGDGLDDVVLDQTDYYYGGRPEQTFVIHGSASGVAPRLDLSDDLEVFSLYASVGEMNLAGAGDINGDGFDDLLIGAPDNGSYYSLDGFWYTALVLGGADGVGPELELSTHSDYNLGTAVAAAGDVNGDGFDDLILSDGRISYVVFGADGFSGLSNMDAELDGTNGFRLIGGGASVAGAGDFDGDGIDDLIVSSRNGDAFLVLGGNGGFPATLDLATLSDEFRFTGAAGRVSGAGDLNDDGYDDLILSSPLADPRGRHDAGSSFVVYGHAMDVSPEFDGVEITRLPGSIDICPAVPDPLL